MTAKSKTQKPRAYISGPMRGYPLFNFPAFHEADDDLTARGFDTHNPARYDEEQGFEPAKSGAEDAFDVATALKHDIGIIVTWADHVFVLPGWQESVGARLEVAVALGCGVAVVDYITGVSITETVETAVA